MLGSILDIIHAIRFYRYIYSCEFAALRDWRGKRGLRSARTDGQADYLSEELSCAMEASIGSAMMGDCVNSKTSGLNISSSGAG